MYYYETPKFIDDPAYDTQMANKITVSCDELDQKVFAFFTLNTTEDYIWMTLDPLKML
jgi:hypothetical protein